MNKFLTFMGAVLLTVLICAGVIFMGSSEYEDRFDKILRAYPKIKREVV